MVLSRLGLARPADRERGEVTKMIVGLGNPGPEHARNRHNVGFQVLELLARRHGLPLEKVQKRARIAAGRITLPDGRDQRVVLARPMTYMNASGEAVGPLAKFYKIASHDIIVISDDLDLPLGRLRVRSGGGSGGQRGVQSIISHLGTDVFARLRIGIGRPPGSMDPAAYVLQDFTSAEEEQMTIARERAADAVLLWMAEGVMAAMNACNGAG